MRKYSEYKDSGVEWIGKIPSHWKISRLRYLHQIMFSGQWGSDPTDSENIVFVVRVSEFDYTRLKISKVPTVRKLVIDSTSPKLIRKGDLILEKSGGGEKTPVGRLVMVADEPIEPTVNSNFTNLIRTNPNKTNSRFLTYLYYVGYIVGITGRNLKQTTGIQNLDTKNLFGELVVVPPIQEQLQISQYLDKKSSRIDSLIEKIERKIELLIEQRTTLISQCVTKGLDPNVQMKDSGVEWIGEIPIDWSATPLKYVVSSNDEVLSENTNPGYEFRYIEISDVNQFSGIGPGKKLSFSISPSRARRILRENDVLISTVRTYLRAIGTVRKCRGNLIGSTGFCVLRATQRILPSYLSYIVNSEQFVASVVSNSVGVSYPAINSSDLVNLKSALPSLHEQAQISQYLDQKTSRIDSLSKKLQRKIELLKEYRQSLISNVVTGKVKVTKDAS